jgi:hypothetical protein
MVKTLLVSLLILFTFVGNIGMSVFTHSCEEDGVFRSYFVKLDDHCEDHEEVKIPPCCQKEGERSTAKKDDCCSDDVAVYQVNFSYFSEYSQQIHLIASAELTTVEFQFIEALPIRSIELPKTINPPPVLSGRDILIKHQVFRI